jgi:methanol metabolism-related c-type cytochrome
MAAATPEESASPAKEEKTAEADTKAAADSNAADAGKTYTPEELKARTSPPDPVSELAKKQGFKFEDGRYRNKDSEPQFIVTKDYMVDWGTWNGFRRYHDACHVCHGPNALGSTFAPALATSLQTMDYGTFIATVSGGRTVNRAGTTYVMPSFGTDKNIMCYIDDIYTYIKSRAAYEKSNHAEGMPPGRPAGREDISDDARAAADACTG